MASCKVARPVTTWETISDVQKGIGIEVRVVNSCGAVAGSSRRNVNNEARTSWTVRKVFATRENVEIESRRRRHLGFEVCCSVRGVVVGMLVVQVHQCSTAH